MAMGVVVGTKRDTYADISVSVGAVRERCLSEVFELEQDSMAVVGAQDYGMCCSESCRGESYRLREGRPVGRSVAMESVQKENLGIRHAGLAESRPVASVPQRPSRVGWETK